MTSDTPDKTTQTETTQTREQGPREATAEQTPAGQPEEIGGPKGAEPTRFGDWERNGRCSDF